MMNRAMGIAGAVVMLLSSSLEAGQAIPDWAAKIRTDHPRLFFNAETWPAVRARALGAERAWYEQFKGRVDRLAAELAKQESPAARDLGPEAAWSAFVFLATDETK